MQQWCNEKGDITCEICHEVGHSAINSRFLTKYPPVLLRRSYFFNICLHVLGTYLSDAG